MYVHHAVKKVAVLWSVYRGCFHLPHVGASTTTSKKLVLKCLSRIKSVELPHSSYKQGVGFTVLNATFNNIGVISWRSVLLLEEIGVPGENHRPVSSHWKIYHIMLYRVYLAIAGFELTTLVVIGTDWIASCKSYNHTVKTTMAPRSRIDLWSQVYIYDWQSLARREQCFSCIHDEN